MKKTVAIITLGCPKNQDDTRHLASYLLRLGFEISSSTTEADAIVIHTCSFIADAKRESIETILRVAQEKKPQAKLFVTGCMVQQHGRELLKEFPEVDAFLGTGQLGSLPQLLEKSPPKFIDRKKPGGFFDPDGLHIPSDGKKTAYLRIIEGCSHLCSFCVIPKLRGPFRSRSESQILDEAKILKESGIEEILIIGQDTGVWGRDLKAGRHLHHLLGRLRDLRFRWIRLMYMHPASMTEEVIQTLAESPDIFTYLDMPLQHIDDEMLRIMKRKLFEKETRALVEKIRRRLPDISFRTTFLLGHPGEKEKHFKRLNEFVKEGHFDYMGSFVLSKEEGTPAAKMTPQVKRQTAEKRQKVLAETQYETALEKAQRRIGAVETVLLEEISEGNMLGRTAREAPEIDAVVALPAAGLDLNQFVEATLNEFEEYEFRATPTQSTPRPPRR